METYESQPFVYRIIWGDHPFGYSGQSGWCPNIGTVGQVVSPLYRIKRLKGIFKKYIIELNFPSLWFCSGKPNSASRYPFSRGS